MPEQKSPSRMPWIVLVLLSLSLLINYVDRSTISIAAPLLKQEFGLSASQLGVLFSAFSWTYAAFLILAGWLVDRYKVNWVLAIGFFTWSVATVLTGLANGFAAFLILRLLLGMGESVAYPAYSRILARHFPAQHRGLANSVIGIGMPGGLALGTFTGGILMARFGWRPFFIVLGLGTLLWLLPWFMWMPRGQGIVPAQDQAVPGVLEIVKQRSAWGTWGGLFALNFLLYFMINWLPTYLVQERQFSMNKVATVGFVYLIAAIVSPIAGWFSDLWISAGATPTRVRKTFMILGQTGFGVSLAGCVVASTDDLAFALLLLSGVGFGFSNSQTWAITQTLAGPNASGKWTGIQNFFGNWAGILGPVITGFVVDRMGGFFWAFVITVIVGLLGCLCWIFVVGPVEQVPWKEQTSAPLPATSVGSA